MEHRAEKTALTTVPLSEIASVRSGFQFRGPIVPDPSGKVRLIQIDDAADGRPLRGDHLTTVRLDRDPAPYLVAAGDVLFLSRGHRSFARAIVEPLRDTITYSYFFIARPKSDAVLPAYLAWYINQPPAQEFLRQARTGTHMPLVPMAAFVRLSIMVPPLDVQRGIVAVAELAGRERWLLDELHQAREKMIQQVCLRAASGFAGKGHQS